MELYLSANFMFHVSAKTIWDVVCATYFWENNVSQIFRCMRRYLAFVRATCP